VFLVPAVVVAVVVGGPSDRVAAVDGCTGLAGSWDVSRDAYEIDSAADLAYIDTNLACLDDSFFLGDDIDLSGTPWDPIGDAAHGDPFTGTFDGDDHEIRGMHISYVPCSGADIEVGLFAAVEDSAVVRNLTITDAQIDGCPRMNEVGILAGRAYASSGQVEITNVEVSGEITLTDPSLDSGEVINAFVGGLIGYAEHTRVADSSADADSTCHDPDYVDAASVDHYCFVGGLIGYTYESEISNSAASGDVFGDISVGGLVGYLGTSNVETSSSTGRVEGLDEVGGLIGQSSSSLISDSFSESTVEVPDNPSDPVDHQYAGGLVGRSYGSEISRSYASGNVTGNRTIGGLVGYIDTPAIFVAISDSYATGDVHSFVMQDPLNYRWASDGAGGLVGRVGSTTKIERSFALGDVSSPLRASGLVSQVDDYSNIIDTYSRGAVTSDRIAGIAFEVGHHTVMRRSYAAGELVGTGVVAGLLSVLPGDNEIVSSFWDVDVSGVADSAGGTGLSTTAMLDRQTYTNSSLDDPWDFTSVWCIKDSLNDGYPTLRTIDFGPESARSCRTRRHGPQQTATFDPDGGTCLVGGQAKASSWDVTFRGSYTLPTAADCSRPGFAFLGWSRSGESTDSDALIHDSISRSATLIAAWGALPAAPLAVSTLANFLCGPCRSVLLVWPVSADASVTSSRVEVDGVATSCTASGSILGLALCFVDGLTSGQTHVFSVSYRNQYGQGPPATASVALR